MITGASNVSNAMGYGKKAARNIDERLMGDRGSPKLSRKFEYDRTPPAHPSEAPPPRRRGSLPALERVKTFDEVDASASRPSRRWRKPAAACAATSANARDQQ